MCSERNYQMTKKDLKFKGSAEEFAAARTEMAEVKQLARDAIKNKHNCDRDPTALEECVFFMRILYPGMMN